MVPASTTYDSVVIGGGFFGLYLAEHLSRRGQRVLVCEREREWMSKASYHNQARVHTGYHYSRSILTALRCRMNYPSFVEEFPDCIGRSHESYYAIGRIGSHVSARQFETFCHRFQAPIRRAPERIRSLFDPRLIEDVFSTEEFVFDSHRLRDAILSRLSSVPAELMLETEAVRVRPTATGSLVVTARRPSEEFEIHAGSVFNCTYSALNDVLSASGLPMIPLKHELAEMALIRVPDVLQPLAVTVMCGPFFSIMPFPSRGLHSLSHVRYTPHCEWHDRPAEYVPSRDVFSSAARRSHFPQMIRDASRYLPALAESSYSDSLWEVKTVLPMTETDDSRPILFLKHHGLEHHHLILGAKIDNVYDAVLEVDELLNLSSTPRL